MRTPWDVPQTHGELFEQKGGDATCHPIKHTQTHQDGSNAALTFNPKGAAYPHKPGYKREGTSRDAANEVATEASVLRQACLDCIMERERTSDEVAAALGRSVLAIRPRISELVATGKVTETTKRRRNVSGKWASVWKAV